MRKATSAAIAVAIALGASAEGYQVNTFSARQEGMGHAGVAMKLGAESQIFNPAGMSLSRKTIDFSGSISAIKATATATYEGKEYTTSNKISTPLNVSAAFKVYDDLYAGVTIYTPYGSSINWGKNWPGAILSQSVDLKVFTVQPTVSWNILPNLSIGAGLMISWGSVNLDKALAPSNNFGNLIDLVNESNQLKYQASVLQGMLTGNPVQTPAPENIPYTDNGVPPASVNLSGKSEIAVGVNVGAMWDITNQWTLGASFRSKMNMKVKAGDARVEYNDEIARALLSSTLDNLNTTNFSASMPCPYVFSVGISYKPIDRLILAFDAQLNGWGTYKQLDINFDHLPEFDQHLKKDYHNAMTYHLFRPVGGLQIDFAFMYVHGTGTDSGTGQYDDILAHSFNTNVKEYNKGVEQYNAAIAMANQMGLNLPQYQGKNFPALNEQETFTAKYAAHAIIPAIGIRYTF